MSKFVHLSVHSEYSMHDSIVRIPDLVSLAVNEGMFAVALTDYQNMHGFVKFYDAARAAGIKPILGAELNLAGYGLTADQVAAPLIALAMNNRGLFNVQQLVSSSFKAHDRGAVTLDELEIHNEGVLILSGGTNGPIGRAVHRNRVDEARAYIARLQSIFPDRFYLQVSRTGRERDEEFLRFSVATADQLNLPLVATCDVIMLAKSDRYFQDVRARIHAKSSVNDRNYVDPFGDDQYFHSQQSVSALFHDLPDAIENSVHIAQRCNVEINQTEHFLPEVPHKSQDISDEEELIQKAKAGLSDFLSDHANALDHPEGAYWERLDYELDTINSMGFAGYFLIVADLVNWARKQDIPIGVRGSGTASLVGFSLQLTGIDPMQYELLFERLLNKERVTMPDYDIDICAMRRDEVVRYVLELFGRERCASICTFQTLKASAVIYAVARALGIHRTRAEALVDYIDRGTLQETFETNVDFRTTITTSEEYGELYRIALPLEGLVSTTGTHPGGIVITPTEVENYVPVYTDGAYGLVRTHLDKDDVESIGLVKFDFLGLKTRTVIDQTVKTINKSHDGDPFDVEEIPQGDAKTYELIRACETSGVFQLESSGMRNTIQLLQPERLDDLCVLIALYRPGPLESGVIEKYAERKKDHTKIRYTHASLRDVLDRTYGLIVYQEDVMNVSRRLAGFSLGNADAMRYAMAKKNRVRMQKMRADFLEGATANDIDRHVADSVFNEMDSFASYAFNKSHAVGYAVVAYQTAFLKANYPCEFMAALITSEIKDGNKTRFLSHLNNVSKLGIHLLPPSINDSTFGFVASTNSIRFGLGAIKRVGSDVIVSICTERDQSGPYKSLADFCDRVDLKSANQNVIEALIDAGTFDIVRPSTESVVEKRSQLLSELEACFELAKLTQENRKAGIIELFDDVEPVAESSRQDNVLLTIDDVLEREREALGITFTRTARSLVEREFNTIATQRIDNLIYRKSKFIDTVPGEVVEVVERMTRTNKPMIILRLKDNDAQVAVFFFRNLKSLRQLQPGDFVIVEGEVTPSRQVQSEMQILGQRLWTITSYRTHKKAAVELSIGIKDISDDWISQVESIMATNPRHRGRPVKLCVQDEDRTYRLTCGAQWKLPVEDNLLLTLMDRFGENQIRVSYDGT